MPLFKHKNNLYYDKLYSYGKDWIRIDKMTDDRYHKYNFCRPTRR